MKNNIASNSIIQAIRNIRKRIGWKVIRFGNFLLTDSTKINAISLPIKKRPLVGSNGNALPYVILKELCGLDNDQTVNLDDLIDMANVGGLVNPMPITANSVGMFARSTTFDSNCDYDNFIEVRYIKSLSSLLHSGIFDILDINERMFMNPDRTLWIYDVNSLNNNFEGYQILIRKNIKNINKPVLGEDIIVNVLSTSDELLRKLSEEDGYMNDILNPRKVKGTYTNTINPLTSEFAVAENPVVEQDSEDGDQKDDGNDIFETLVRINEEDWPEVDHDIDDFISEDFTEDFQEIVKNDKDGDILPDPTYYPEGATVLCQESGTIYAKVNGNWCIRSTRRDS